MFPRVRDVIESLIVLDKPPPAREILRVAEAGEGWGVPASWN
jgi:hypothetical protein